jgi:hypothetical protein
MKGQKGRLLWTMTGPGVAYSIQWIMLQGQKQLLVSWGMGKGAMKAPLTLQVLNPKTGQGSTVWSKKTERNQPLDLHLINLDSDSDQEVLFTHFVSKYHSEMVILDSYTQAQTSLIFKERMRGGQIRMGTSWGLANLDPYPGLDLYVGRVYGDVKGEYGDLLYYSSKEGTPLTQFKPYNPDPSLPILPSKFQKIQALTPLNTTEVLPTTRGVKQAWIVEIDQKQHLFFADGWVANYGKKARALLKRVVWNQGRVAVETVAKSNQDFTFFDLFTQKDPQTKRPLIFVRGNRNLSLLTPQKQGIWTQHTLLTLSPIVNLAIGYQKQGWFAYIPQESGTQIRSFKLPSLNTNSVQRSIQVQSTPEGPQ